MSHVIMVMCELFGANDGVMRELQRLLPLQYHSELMLQCLRIQNAQLCGVDSAIGSLALPVSRATTRTCEHAIESGITLCLFLWRCISAGDHKAGGRARWSTAPSSRREGATHCSACIAVVRTLVFASTCARVALQDTLTSQAIASAHGSRWCVVCQTEPRCVLLLPCRHMCVCLKCVDALEVKARERATTGADGRGGVRCPLCTAVVQGKTHVLF